MGPYQICRLPAMRPPAGSPFPSTAPAAPQVRRIGMHGGEGGLAPGRRGAATVQKPAALRRGSHDVLPGFGSAQAARHEHQGAPAAQREPGWRH